MTALQAAIEGTTAAAQAFRDEAGLKPGEVEAHLLESRALRLGDLEYLEAARLYGAGPKLAPLPREIEVGRALVRNWTTRTFWPITAIAMSPVVYNGGAHALD